jgi:hypothetical protein
MNEIINITAIIMSFTFGCFLGALWMFYSLEKSNKKLLEELDIKTKLLQKDEKKV